MIGVLTGISVAQRPKPVPQPPARGSQSGQPAKPDPREQNKNRDDDVVSGDEAVRLGTDLVNVLFTAVDRNNRVIGDIRQDEVVILEDGRPQQVFTFKRETTLPINIAILMDLSGSQEYTFPQEKIAAGEFLRSIIRPGKDFAAILTFQDDVELVQGLSSRTDTLNRAFDQIQYSRRLGSASTRHQATALYDAIYITADEILARDDLRRSAPDEQVTRRAIILLTDGVDNASSRNSTKQSIARGGQVLSFIRSASAIGSDSKAFAKTYCGGLARRPAEGLTFPAAPRICYRTFAKSKPNCAASISSRIRLQTQRTMGASGASKCESTRGPKRALFIAAVTTRQRKM